MSREWPPAPSLLWQDKHVERLVLERYKEGQSTQFGSVEDRVAIELLVQKYIGQRYVAEGGAEKIKINHLKLACALSYECVVFLDVTLKRWDGFKDDGYYLVFEKSVGWSLQHIYPLGGATLVY